MKGALALALTACAAGGALGAGAYDPERGAYVPEQDPKTVVRAGRGVGSVRFGQRIATVADRDFGPILGRRVFGGVRGRPRGWMVRSYGGLQIVARMDGRKRIVGFVLTSPGFQTRQGLGVGDHLKGAKSIFGAPRRVSARRGRIIWRLASSATPVLLRTDGEGRIQRWAITSDPLIPARALLG